MKYKELLEALSELTEEQLNMDVTVYGFDDEFYPAIEFDISCETDILDEGSPFLTINN